MDAGGEARVRPRQVILYEDFQCPVCQAFEQANGAFLDEAVKNGDISIEYRLLAFLDRASPNQYSSRAGSAALCAFDSGGGEAYKKATNLLWANQPQENSAGPEDAALVDTLDQAGVSGDAVEACVLKGTFVPGSRKPLRPLVTRRSPARRRSRRRQEGRGSQQGRAADR